MNIFCWNYIYELLNNFKQDYGYKLFFPLYWYI
jgi:hypothetical protein